MHFVGCAVDPIDGVTLEWFDANGNLVATVETGPDGSYSFPGLESGDYTIEQTQPPGYAGVGWVSSGPTRDRHCGR